MTPDLGWGHYGYIAIKVSIAGSLNPLILKSKVVMIRSMQVWVKLSKVLSSLARNRNRKVSCLPPCPSGSWLLSLSRAPLWDASPERAVHSVNVSASPGPASVTPHRPKSNHHFGRYSLSLSQEAFGSTTLSTNCSGSKGLELLR